MAVEGSPSDVNSSDSWTPDQETALLKALVHYKPVGLHAHFRMLSIRNHLLNSGTIDAEASHTRIPGIWTKIKSLYDVEQLNEREDEVITSLGGESADDEDNDEAANEGANAGSSRRGKRAKKEAEEAAAARITTKTGYWRDFELPANGDEGGFEALMWERRLNPGGTPDGSDWDTRSQSRTRAAGSGREATDEPRSSPAGRGTRSGRKGRISQLKDEMEVDSPGPTRGSRRVSRTTSEVEGNDDDDQHMEDAGDEEDEDDDEGEDDEDDESGDQDEGDEEKKVGGGKRRRGAVGRGRGKRGRRRK